MEHDIMAIHCKVCNASKTTNIDQINLSDNWECQTCGNLLDANGYIVTPN